MQKVLMSSANIEWETPNTIFSPLNSIFKFSLDAAASESNTKCLVYINQEQNALTVDWKEYMLECGAQTNTVWLNPPYSSKLVLPFMKKVEEEYNEGLTIVTLTAARTETKFFRIIWERARYLIFIYQRLKFELQGQPVGTATFPSVISVFTDHQWNLASLNSIGHVIQQNVISNKELRTLP
jgi:phage N-6-adenine-methyltransferase